MHLEGKNAVVSGAAMGIGHAITKILVEKGAKVALLDVDTKNGESFAAYLNDWHGEGKALFLKCDVQSEEEIKASFQKAVEILGGIDIVCNNAGILDEAAWEKMININLMGVIRGSYAALSHMNMLTGGRGGVVVNIAAMAGVDPLSSCPVYSATESGVISFTQAMAHASEASGFGIRFHVLCPGFVLTDMFTDIPEKLGQFTHLLNVAYIRIFKLGLLTESEMGVAFLQLVKEDSKNGKVLVVYTDGRHYMNFKSTLPK